MLNDHNIQTVKIVGDVAAASVTIASLLSYLPPIAAGFSIVWVCVQFFESKTGQKFLSRVKKLFKRD